MDIWSTRVHLELVHCPYPLIICFNRSFISVNRLYEYDRRYLQFYIDHSYQLYFHIRSELWPSVTIDRSFPWILMILWSVDCLRVIKWSSINGRSSVSSDFDIHRSAASVDRPYKLGDHAGLSVGDPRLLIINVWWSSMSADRPCLFIVSVF